MREVPSLCTQALAAGATLCDGFETTPSDFTVMATAPDTFVLDTTKFYRGAKSMKFTATNAAYITETKTFTGTTKATNNAFWGRYFFFNNMTTAPMSHSVFGTMHGTDATANAEDFHFVGGSRGKLQAQIQFAADEYTDNMKMPAAADPPFPLAADGWQCWEWQIQADDSFDFYINGTEVMEMKIVAGKAAMSGSELRAAPGRHDSRTRVAVLRRVGELGMDRRSRRWPESDRLRELERPEGGRFTVLRRPDSTRRPWATLSRPARLR